MRPKHREGVKVPGPQLEGEKNEGAPVNKRPIMEKEGLTALSMSRAPPVKVQSQPNVGSHKIAREEGGRFAWRGSNGLRPEIRKHVAP